ncbi:MAG: hypothetical protein WDM91_03425 [Rhizomicrobium sp.]
MAIPSLQDFLRWMQGRDQKKKSAFDSEREAYEFVQKVYKDTGGVSPELRNAYLFYLKNIHDDCPAASSGPGSN